MQKLSLEKAVSDLGYEALAAKLGCSVGAIAKAIKLKRKVTVCKSAAGEYSAFEIKPFPGRK